jgi:hypothetical protein
LSGNERIKKEIKGVSVIITVSNWDCNSSFLSFDLKAVAEKGWFDCTVFDRTLKGYRYNQSLFEQRLTEVLERAEAAKNSKT